MVRRQLRIELVSQVLPMSTASKMTLHKLLLRYIYYGLRRLALKRRIVPDDHSLIDHFEEWLFSLPKT